MRRPLQDNLKRVRERIEAACARTHRSASGVRLIAVTKYVSLDVIRSLVELGVEDFGESRPQELIKRAAATREWLGRRRRPDDRPSEPEPRWHLIGPLQRNKVNKVLPWVSLIHSVDTLRLAEEIDAQSAKLGAVTPILLEVNATGETNRHGIAFAAAPHVVEVLSSLKRLRLLGMMAMGPNTTDTDAIRRVFDRVAELFQEIRTKRGIGENFRVLSMGMSGDFEIAIESGATHVRVGSALYEGLALPASAGHQTDPAQWAS